MELSPEILVFRQAIEGKAELLQRAAPGILALVSGNLIGN